MAQAGLVRPLWDDGLHKWIITLLARQIREECFTLPMSSLDKCGSLDAPSCEITADGEMGNIILLSARIRKCEHQHRLLELFPVYFEEP